MDNSDFEIEILTEYLRESYKNKKINTKQLAEDFIDLQQWDDVPREAVILIRERIRGIKRGKALVNTKELKLDDGRKIVQKDGFISMDQILNLIGRDKHIVEFEPLVDGTYHIIYDE